MGHENITAVLNPAAGLARVLFGGVLALVATDNRRNLEGRIQYAETKDVPVPSPSVPGSNGGLPFGSVGIALWHAPAVAAVSGFFVGVTPLMHDFWTVDDPDERQQQVIEFSKNTALLGAALAVLQLGRSQESRE